MTIQNDPKTTKPKLPPAYMQDNHLLQTKDITGAMADTRYASPFVRREYRNTNYLEDITGAKADTIKHSIVTTRQTHPLQPIYQALDQDEMLLPIIPPVIPAEMVKIPTLPHLPPQNESIQGGNSVNKLPTKTIRALQQASVAYPVIGQTLSHTKIGIAAGITGINGGISGNGTGYGVEKPGSAGLSNTWGTATLGDNNNTNSTPFQYTAQHTFQGK